VVISEANFSRVKTYLDSGANEFMLKNKSIGKNFQDVRTTIQTAGGSRELNATSAGQVDFFFSDLRTPVPMGAQNRALFSEGLVDNLASVSRLTETGLKVIFDKDGYKVVRGEVTVRGVVVHKEAKEAQSGLYPLTLFIRDKVPRDIAPIRDVTDLRKSLPDLVGRAEERNNKARATTLRNFSKDISNINFDVAGKIAKTYVRSGMSPIERWHLKLGHQGYAALKKCSIPGLTIPREPFRCEACVKGKIHVLGHSKKTASQRPTYQPGECIHTDHQGPYSRAKDGSRYSQIFFDMASQKIWTVRMGDKTGAYNALERVLQDSKTRSGRACKFLRTDGDGVFGRSAQFQDIQKRWGFIHERPAPYDHEQSCHIDRECRTLLEATATALIQSGAPPSFWHEAAAHYTFTRNNTPRHEVTVEGKKIFLSPNQIFEGHRNPFNLSRLVAFGTQLTCFLPKERRPDHKGPSQSKSFDGVMLGYAQDCRAYRVWDIEARKVREVSFHFCVISEGFFPFRKQTNWPEEKDQPVFFFPTLETALDKREWTLFDFTAQQELEALRKVSVEDRKSASPGGVPGPKGVSEVKGASEEVKGVSEDFSGDFKHGVDVPGRSHTTQDFWQRALSEGRGRSVVTRST
jgi:hypothetical protein